MNRVLDPSGIRPDRRHARWNLPYARPDDLTDEDLDASIEDAKSGRALLHPCGGVYIILNVENGVLYIGRSRTNIKERFGVHMSRLRHGKHENVLLAADAQRYGVDVFRPAAVSLLAPFWSYLAEIAMLRLAQARPNYNIQNMDYLGRARLADEYIATLRPECQEHRARAQADSALTRL